MRVFNGRLYNSTLHQLVLNNSTPLTLTVFLLLKFAHNMYRETKFIFSSFSLLQIYRGTPSSQLYSTLNTNLLTPKLIKLNTRYSKHTKKCFFKVKLGDVMQR